MLKKVNLWITHFHFLLFPLNFTETQTIFDLNDMEKDIIINHMWPVTIKLPRTKEAFILTLVDKYCATYETVSYTVKQLKKKPSWQYAYLMLWLVIRK